MGFKQARTSSEKALFDYRTDQRSGQEKKWTQQESNLKAESFIMIPSDGAADRRCGRDVQSAAGQLDEAAAQTNTPSKTEWNSCFIHFWPYVLRYIQFLVFLGDTAYRGADCCSSTLENDSHCSPFSVGAPWKNVHRSKWFNPALRLEIIFALTWVKRPVSRVRWFYISKSLDLFSSQRNS